MSDDLVVGLDLGGTKIVTALVDRAGTVRDPTTVPTEAAEGPEKVMERMERAIEPLVNNGRAAAIGLCSPGPLDATTGTVLSPPNLPGWDDVPLRGLIEDRFGLPTTLEKDVNAAMVAEMRLGVGQGYRDIVYVSLGTGIGGAIVQGGELVYGTGLAGEIGHIIVAADGPACNCGARGCLEALASGTAIAAQAASAAEADPHSPLALRAAASESLDATTVLAAATEGDPVSAQIMAAASRHLGLGIASLVNLLAPELVIIGGGLARLGPAFLNPMRDVVRESSYVQRLRPAEIVTARAPDEAGIVGAALIAFEALGRA